MLKRYHAQKATFLAKLGYNATMELVEITDRATWDNFVAKSPWGHPLQLWGWGETKRRSEWVPTRLALMHGNVILAGVQVLLWRLPRLSYWIVYAPRGPVVEPGSELAEVLLAALTIWARQNNGLYVRIEPAWVANAPSGWVRAKNNLQMAATYTIDLSETEEEIQGPMSRKHRQYIRKAARDGVTVVRAPRGDTSGMYKLYVDTAKRAGFGIHSQNYYVTLERELGENNFLYYAYFKDKPVAFLWLAAAGKTAYELYGGVNEAGAEMKANYVLKWEAMRAMKAAGYEVYDFNGRLNEGVSRFKDGFGPDETNYIGTYDFPLNRLGYQLWESLWPVAKRVGRGLRGR